MGDRLKNSPKNPRSACAGADLDAYSASFVLIRCDQLPVLGENRVGLAILITRLSHSSHRPCSGAASGGASSAHAAMGIMALIIPILPIIPIVLHRATLYVPIISPLFPTSASWQILAQHHTHIAFQAHLGKWGSPAFRWRRLGGNRRPGGRN